MFKLLLSEWRLKYARGIASRKHTWKKHCFQERKYSFILTNYYDIPLARSMLRWEIHQLELTRSFYFFDSDTFILRDRWIKSVSLRVRNFNHYQVIQSSYLVGWSWMSECEVHWEIYMACLLHRTQGELERVNTMCFAPNRTELVKRFLECTTTLRHWNIKHVWTLLTFHECDFSSSTLIYRFSVLYPDSSFLSIL